MAALSRRAALGAIAVAASAPAAAAVQPDPIFPAIEALRAAEAALSAALRDLDEDDAEQLRAADEAADRSGDARNALSAMLPTTPAGFRALVQFHAEDVMRTSGTRGRKRRPSLMVLTMRQSCSSARMRPVAPC